MAAVRLSDVARQAGVSPATASRVLNGSARTPAAEIAERVREVAAALGYIPNAQAQSLARSSSGLIGLVVHDIADPYFSSIARGVQTAAREAGKTLLLISTETPAEERVAVEALASRRADAIVIAGSRSCHPEHGDDNDALAHAAARYEGNGGTLVMIGSPLIPQTHDGEGAPAAPGSPDAAGASETMLLAIPNGPLAADLARALVGAGWSRFAVVAGPGGLQTSDLRLEGFQRGLRDAGVAEATVLRAAFNRGGGFGAGEELEALIRQKADPLCVFAVNDRMAMGAVAGLRARGLGVPADYGIAGFDDIDTLADFVPELTTVHLDLEQIGHDAASAALGAGTDGADLLPAEGRVVLRASTAR
ncbi:LacI family DNA-binding transcriptional regulator [Sinomonas sp. ASV486]|uniref:LacI family DNA-binding transcriptional regulator n=1 Tax=Sinomonas sp. ASV486 TaxID=3051170 RepID=UPI0027DE025D|nr:LacI family DNA-binding transcriptional regulator [Sinomonas sp. ASV486]MDQ4491238.1 LacI family DNA-binding transcriptional regulator [Sinomonas sp. ASV486]